MWALGIQEQQQIKLVLSVSLLWLVFLVVLHKEALIKEACHDGMDEEIYELKEDAWDAGMDFKSLESSAHLHVITLAIVVASQA